MKEDIVMLCVRVVDKPTRTPESIISECDFGCGHKVWVQPHNLMEKKICIPCLLRLEGKELDINRFGMKLQDLMRAKEYIKDKESGQKHENS